MTSLCDASMMSLVDVMYHVTCLDKQFVIFVLNLEPMRVWHTQMLHPEWVQTVCMCTRQSKYEKYVTWEKRDVIPTLTSILGNTYNIYI